VGENPEPLNDLLREASRTMWAPDAAKLILGHVSSDTTDIYLLEEVQEAMKVAKQLDAGNR